MKLSEINKRIFKYRNLKKLKRETNIKTNLYMLDKIQITSQTSNSVDKNLKMHQCMVAIIFN